MTNLTKELSACTDDIKTRMAENQLKINDNKSGALLFASSSSLKPSTIPLPDSVTLGSHNIPISDSARNLGFILDPKLSMNRHAILICQTAYSELKRRFLAEDAAKSLVTSYIISRIDYCKCFPVDTPSSVIQPLRTIENCRKTRSLTSPSPPLYKPEKHCTGFPI